MSAHHGKHLIDGHKLAARSALRCASCNLRLHMIQKLHPRRCHILGYVTGYTDERKKWTEHTLVGTQVYE